MPLDKYMEDKDILVIPVKNSGLIFELPKQEDWVFGGITGAVNGPIFPDGHGWLLSQAEEQAQANNKFDTYSCVTFASTKAAAYYLKKVHDLTVDFSQMFTSVMSGTIPYKGNSVRNVLESLRKDGYLIEVEYPFTPDTTQAQFFAYPTITLRNKAKKKLASWKFEWETLSTADNVPHDVIADALKYSPVIATGFAWASYYGNQGIYYDYNNQANHCFLIVDHNQGNAEWDLLADDSYSQDFIFEVGESKDKFLKKLHPSYRVWSAHKLVVKSVPIDISLINKIINMFKKISRDVHGGLWFVKNGAKQKIENWEAFAGAVIDEIGVERNGLTDAQLNTLTNAKFFGK